MPKPCSGEEQWSVPDFFSFSTSNSTDPQPKGPMVQYNQHSHPNHLRPRSQGMQDYTLNLHEPEEGGPST